MSSLSPLHPQLPLPAATPAPLPTPASARIGARLQSFHPEWGKILSEPMATHIRRGYHWSWKEKPPLLSLPKLSTQRPDVQLQVQNLLDLGAVYEVPVQKCFLSRIFTVPKEPTGTRLILDVSTLNEYISVPPLTMSNHNTLSKRLVAPAWMASLDLKDAYLHVPIRQNQHKFLASS